MAIGFDMEASEETDLVCERCGNPVSTRESVWLQDASGRLRITTLDAIEPRAKENVRVWHAGCLHA